MCHIYYTHVHCMYVLCAADVLPALSNMLGLESSALEALAASSHLPTAPPSTADQNTVTSTASVTTTTYTSSVRTEAASTTATSDKGVCWVL